MSKQWFYQFMGSTIGPLPSAELKARVQKGQITAETPVRLGDDGKWQPADRVKGLLDPTAPPVSARTAASPAKPAAVPEVMPVETLKLKPSFDHERTYHIQGDDQPHEDAGEESGEYDFFRFVGFEQAIGPRLHQVFVEHCSRNEMSLTQGTRKAIAEFVGRKDLSGEDPPSSAPDTEAEMKVSDTSIEMPQQS